MQCIHRDKRKGLPGAVLFMVLALVALPFLVSCGDPLTRNKTLTTFFDGVPDLPPVEELCEEYMGDKYKEYYDALAARLQEAAGEGQEGKKSAYRSYHRPFEEKNCEGCHNFKSSNLLIRPADQLCFVCHKNFIRGSQVHGPVAVGDCLACHFPHDSPYPALLQKPRNTICSKCHQEERLAANMHEQVINHEMNCVDCHDPHSGNAQYFLK